MIVFLYFIGPKGSKLSANAHSGTQELYKKNKRKELWVENIIFKIKEKRNSPKDITIKIVCNK